MVRNNFIFHLQCNICNPPTTISFLQSYQKLLIFMKLPFINLSIDLSQNLTPEPCLTKTLSDIIKSQLQQSLNRDVSIVFVPPPYVICNITCTPTESILIKSSVQKCRKIRGLGCVNQASNRARVTQPSPCIFLHICTT